MAAENGGDIIITAGDHYVMTYTSGYGWTLNSNIFLSPYLWFIILLIVVFHQVPYWRVAKKAGYPGWLSLLVMVPFFSHLFIWLFAFSDWPSRQR